MTATPQSTTSTLRTFLYLELGEGDFGYLLSLLPDEFLRLDVQAQDYLYRKMYHAIDRGASLEAVAAEVGRAIRMALEYLAAEVVQP